MRSLPCHFLLAMTLGCGAGVEKSCDEDTHAEDEDCVADDEASDADGTTDVDGITDVDVDSGDDGGSDADADADADSGADADVDADADSGSDTEVDPSAMRVDQELVIELDSNPSTGYGWEIQSPTSDDVSVLELASSEFIPPDSSAGIGAGGTEVFRFRANGVGSSTILIHYIQLWVPDEPAEIFTQDVTVID
jgi:predicted secreted protein